MTEEEKMAKEIRLIAIVVAVVIDIICLFFMVLDFYNLSWVVPCAFFGIVSNIIIYIGVRLAFPDLYGNGDENDAS